MRFLTSLLAVGVLILVVLLTGFFFVREYLLYQGVQNFKKTVLILERSQRDAYSTCESKVPDLLGIQGTSGTPVSQIRFTSSTDYILEVICPQFSFDPVVLSKEKLSYMVTKLPGSSGIILGTDQRSGVELTVFEGLQKEINEFFGTSISYIQNSRSVVVENNRLLDASTVEDLGDGPLTSCEGYGYQCCYTESYIGEGDKIDGLPGCEKSCYAQCISRPVVLSFTSNPFFDIKTRTVTINPGESVDFSYLVDVGKSETLQVDVDFGDSQKESLFERTGTVTHVYNCLADACEYTAVVRAIDAAGIKSAETSIAKLLIQVRGAESPEI